MTFAQFERETISERVRDKIAESKRMGKFCGGMTPMGYRRNNETRRIDIDSKEAIIVRWIFKKYLKWKSCGLVAKALNLRGLKTRKWTSSHEINHGGKSWCTARIHSILTNPLYAGLIRHQKQMYPGEHIPIITQEMWEQTQELLSHNNQGRHKCFGQREATLLMTLLHCEECNCALTPTYTDKNRKRYFYYVCQKSRKYPDHICQLPQLPSKEIENVVFMQLEMLIQCYSFRENIIEAIRQTQVEYCRIIKKECSGLQTLIAIGKDHDTNMEMKDRLEMLDRKYGAFQQEIKVKAIDRYLDQFSVLWNEMGSQTKIELLDLIVERIEVYPTKISIFLVEDFICLKEEIASRFRSEQSLFSVHQEDGCLILESPIVLKRVNGQNKIEATGVNYDNNRRCLLHAIALAWRWNEELCAGKFKNVSELARTLKQSAAYTGRILALSNLAPSIVEAIVYGDIPNGLSLPSFMKTIGKSNIRN